MQSVVLHLPIITVVPLQSFPPHNGVGLLQLLTFVITPSHRLEQFPTGDQFDQPPSTTHTIQYIITLMHHGS